MRRILIVLVAVIALNQQTATRGAESRFANSPTGSTASRNQPTPAPAQTRLVSGFRAVDEGHTWVAPGRAADAVRLSVEPPIVAIRAANNAAVQESVTLTTPVPVCTQTTFYLRILHMENTGTDAAPVWRVVAEVRDNCGTVIRDEHTATTAVTGNALVTTLNAPGTYANSLFKRILLHLQSEGKIGAGAVTGQPQ